MLNRSIWWVRMVLGLMLGLTVVSAMGCAQAGFGRGVLAPAVAGASAQGMAELGSSHDQIEVSGGGVVDLSGPLTIRDATPDEVGARGFVPGTLLAATEVASWVGEGFDGPTTSVELRNACMLDFEYGFGPSPGELDGPRRALDGYSIQTQLIPEGHWLHLWDGDRWLGAAVTTVEDGSMEIAADCETLEVHVELHDRGPMSFAIHWELDAEAPADVAGSGPAEPVELAIDTEARPEIWGAEAGEHIELTLANLCAEPVDYAFVPSLDTEPEAPATATIEGHAQRTVEIPVDWWLRYQALEDGWRGGATTSFAGGVVWIAADCIDYGVGDGHEVGLGGS